MAFASFEAVGPVRTAGPILVIPLRDLEAVGDPFYAVAFYLTGTVAAPPLEAGASSVQDARGPFATAEEAIAAVGELLP